MQPPTRKATIIVRLWTDSDPIDTYAWRGTAEFIGSGLSCQFQELDEFINWLRQELVKIEEIPEKKGDSIRGTGIGVSGKMD